MDTRINDPALGLVDIYNKLLATKNRPHVTKYAGNIVIAVLLFCLAVGAIVDWTDSIGSALAWIFLVAGVVIYIAKRLYAVAYNLSLDQQLNALLQQQRITSVSLDQWPQCYDALVQSGTVAPESKHGVLLMSDVTQPCQALAIAEYLSRTLPLIQGVDLLDKPVSPEIIRRTVTNQLLAEAKACSPQRLSHAFSVII